MIPIKVNISSVIDRYELSESQIEDLANMVTTGLANEYANNMISLAKQMLNKTRKMFVDGIHVVEISKYSCAVDLVGVMPNAITFGMSPFDMKVGFAKSSKKTAKKGGGWYMTIPFRYANPNAVASSEVFSGVMPPAIYNLAKMLKEGSSIGRSELPAGFDDTKFRPAVQVGAEVFPVYTHDSPKFAGLTKTGKGSNSQYNTFRRVSDNSDTASWIHSGLEPKNIHLLAFDQMDIMSTSKRIIDSFLDNHLK